jgi:hypothetical protein
MLLPPPGSIWGMLSKTVYRDLCVNDIALNNYCLTTYQCDKLTPQSSRSREYTKTGTLPCRILTDLRKGEHDPNPGGTNSNRGLTKGWLNNPN